MKSTAFINDEIGGGHTYFVISNMDPLDNSYLVVNSTSVKRDTKMHDPSCDLFPGGAPRN